MFDFSLPPAIGVLAIDMHHFHVPVPCKDNLSASLPTTTQQNISPDDNPPPPPRS